MCCLNWWLKSGGPMYDVIVTGAGPAGSTAAIALAKSGMRTLLIDRETFPREKACGDAVPAQGFRLLNELGVPPFRPDEVTLMEHVFVQGPRGVNLKMPLTKAATGSAGIVTRYVFDRALYDYALANGAE